MNAPLAIDPDRAEAGEAPPVARLPRLDLLTIDALRGLAAVWVVTYHAYGFFWRGDPPPMSVSAAGTALATLVFDHGWLGVTLFFVLSGFCIHLPSALTDAPTLGGRAYAIRRLVRIWPPYAVAVCVGAAMTFIKTHNATGTLGNAAAHLGFWIWGTEPLAPYTAALIGMVVLWTVVIEVQLYACYAILYPAIRRFGIGRVTLVCVAFGIVYHVADEVLRQRSIAVPGIVAARYFAPARLGEWMLGAWVADGVARRRFRGPSTAMATLGWIALGLLIVAATRAAVIAGGFDKYFGDPTTAIGFAVIVAAAALAERRVADSVVAPPGRRSVGGTVLAIAAASGRRCYSLYLFHFATLAIVGELAVRAYGLTDADKDAFGGSLWWFGVTMAAVATTFVVAEAAYRLIELPSHRAARRWARARA